MRFCILMVRSSTTSGSLRLRWRALLNSPRSSSAAAAEGGGEGLACAVPCMTCVHNLGLDLPKLWLTADIMTKRQKCIFCPPVTRYAVEFR